MNLLLYGGEGYGKTMYLKCILKECYDITLDDLKKNNYFNTLYYKSIYIFDFIIILVLIYVILLNLSENILKGH